MTKKGTAKAGINLFYSVLSTIFGRFSARCTQRIASFALFSKKLDQAAIKIEI
jgi:hypothetical protein